MGLCTMRALGLRWAERLLYLPQCLFVAARVEAAEGGEFFEGEGAAEGLAPRRSTRTRTGTGHRVPLLWPRFRSVVCVRTVRYSQSVRLWMLGEVGSK